MLTQMAELTRAYYFRAMHIGVHSFHELSGLMNVLIVAAHAAEARGEAWVWANACAGQPLQLAEHQRQYLAEKLSCIFGCSVQWPRTR
jgi:hypothetical protein